MMNTITSEIKTAMIIASPPATTTTTSTTDSSARVIVNNNNKNNNNNNIRSKKGGEGGGGGAVVEKMNHEFIYSIIIKEFYDYEKITYFQDDEDQQDTHRYKERGDLNSTSRHRLHHSHHHHRRRYQSLGYYEKNEVEVQYLLVKKILLQLSSVCKLWHKIIQSLVTHYAIYFGELNFNYDHRTSKQTHNTIDIYYQGVKNQLSRKPFSLFKRDYITTLLVKKHFCPDDENCCQDRIFELLRWLPNLNSLILYTTNQNWVNTVAQTFPHIENIEVRMGVVWVYEDSIRGIIPLQSPNIGSVSARIEIPDTIRDGSSPFKNYVAALEKFIRYWRITSLNIKFDDGQAYIQNSEKIYRNPYTQLCQLCQLKHLRIGDKINLTELNLLINLNHSIETLEFYMHMEILVETLISDCHSIKKEFKSQQHTQKQQQQNDNNRSSTIKTKESHYTYSQNTLDHWNLFCNALSNNTNIINLTFRQLATSPLSQFDNTHGDYSKITEPFSKIWEMNHKIQNLYLEIPLLFGPSFFKSMSSNQSIKQLSLHGEACKETISTPMCDMIRWNTTLRELNFDFNQFVFGDDLFEALKVNKSIHVLQGRLIDRNTLFKIFNEVENIKYLGIFPQPLQQTTKDNENNQEDNDNILTITKSLDDKRMIPYQEKPNDHARRTSMGYFSYFLNH